MKLEAKIRLLVEMKLLQAALLPVHTEMQTSRRQVWLSIRYVESCDSKLHMLNWKLQKLKDNQRLIEKI